MEVRKEGRAGGRGKKWENRQTRKLHGTKGGAMLEIRVMFNSVL